MVRCTQFAAVNARWTTSNQMLLVLEPQWIKSTERAKRPLIPPVYSLRRIRAYDELQIIVTEVGQFKQTVTPQMTVWRILIGCWITNNYCFSTVVVVARTRLIVTLYVHCYTICSLPVMYPTGTSQEISTQCCTAMCILRQATANSWGKWKRSVLT